MSDDKVAVSAELELDGHIYIVEKDEDGEIIKKEELDGIVCLRALLAVIEDAIRNPLAEEVLCKEVQE